MIEDGQLEELVAEIKNRWPRIQSLKVQNISAVPRTPAPLGVLLVSTNPELRTAMKKAGYWHRGFPAADAYWRI